MKTFACVTGYSLELPAISNRLVPIIREALYHNYHVIVYSPSESRIPDFDPTIEYRCLPRNIDTSRGFYSRALNEIYSSFLLMKEVYKHKFDIVFTGIPSIFLLFFSKACTNQQILDVRDIAWEYIEDSNIINFFIKRAFRFLGIHKLKNFEKIICTNRSEVNYFRDVAKFPASNIILLPNGIRQEQYTAISKLPAKRSSSNINISYIGNIGTAQSLDNFVLAAKCLPHLNFHIVGAGRDFLRIKALITSLGLTNCHTYGRLPWFQVLDIYSKTDILFAQLSNVFTTAVPSKLYEYLATGKFIIYSGSGEAVHLLSQFENNLVIKNSHQSSLVSAINSVIDSANYLSISHFNQEKIRKHYIRESNVKNIFNELVAA